MSNLYTNIGRRVPKLDAPDKATGRARYLQDLKLPGMLHGKILWSEYPHARIVNIDTSEALKIPGVVAVITAKDLPERNSGFMKDNPPLKRDKVRSLRDEVAAVAAVSEEIAEAALECIRVDYLELPGIFDPEDSLRDGAPLVHEENKNNRVKMKYRFENGDVEEGRKRSVHIVKGRFKLHFVTHTCLGTCCCIADFDAKGKLIMYSPSQVPFLHQKDMADVMEMSGSDIRIIQPTIGGAFGSKLDLYPYEIICAHLAKAVGRPVRLSFSRTEEFCCTPTRQPAIIESEAGVDAEGKLTFREAHIILDAGAYVSWGPTIPYVMMNSFSSLYRVTNVSFATSIAYTNNIYAGAFRGYGNPQGTFVVETQMDELAKLANMDPLNFRILNSNRPGETTPQGMKVTTCGLEECLKRAAKGINWKENRNAAKGIIRRGVGLASFFHVGGGARVYRSDGCGAIVKIDDFGQVTLITGSSEIGQGSETVLAQITAEELGVRVEDVKVINSDTDIKPWDVGVHASRTTFIAGNAARLAAAKAKRKILEMAAPELGVQWDELDINDRFIFCKAKPEKRILFHKILRKKHFAYDGNIIVTEHFYDPPTKRQDRDFKGNVSATYAFGTQAAEVEVDTETGIVRVLKMVVADDVGRALNPMLLEGQLEGGIAQGIGYGIYENLLLNKGRVMNPTFLDYKIPTVRDMPEIKVEMVETHDREGPFGAKGIAESGSIPTAAAIANAVYDAVGVRIRELPLTPEKVLCALCEKND